MSNDEERYEQMAREQESREEFEALAVDELNCELSKFQCEECSTIIIAPSDWKPGNCPTCHYATEIYPIDDKLDSGFEAFCQEQSEL